MAQLGAQLMPSPRRPAPPSGLWVAILIVPVDWASVQGRARQHEGHGDQGRQQGASSSGVTSGSLLKETDRLLVEGATL